MKKYPKYKSSEIEWLGDIPEHWKRGKIKYYFKEHSGNGFPQNEQGKESGIPFYKVSDINGKSIRVSKSKNYVSQTIIAEYKWNIIPGNTIVTAKIGEALKKNHRKISVSYCIIDNNCIGLEPKNINIHFSYYLLSVIDFNWFSNPGTVPSISVFKLKALNLYIPSKYEQHQIANYVAKKTLQIDTYISKKQKQIELLKEKRAALINHAVTKGLDPNVKMKASGIEWLGDIPEHWEVKRLSTYGKFSKGNGIRKDEVKPSGNPCIRYGEIYTKYNRIVYNPISFIDNITKENSVLIEKGTILFAGSGETIEDIGKTILYNGERDVYVGGDIIILRLNFNLNPIFISYILNSHYTNYQKSINGKGEIIVHIYSKNLREIKTIVPSDAEQKQITDYLDKKTTQIDNLVDKIERKIEFVKEYRTTLISDAVTGKIDVREETI